MKSINKNISSDTATTHSELLVTDSTIDSTIDSATDCTVENRLDSSFLPGSENTQSKSFSINSRTHVKSVPKTIKKAVILAGDLGLAYTSVEKGEKYGGHTHILGMSLINRAIFSAQKAGIQQIFLLNPSEKEADSLRVSPGTSSPSGESFDSILLSVINLSKSDMAGFLQNLRNEMFLLLSSNVAFHPDLLKEPGHFFVSNAEELEEILTNLLSASSQMQHPLKGGLFSEKSASSQKLLFTLVVAGRSSFKNAEKLLLNTARKPTDGFIYKYLNRPISLRLTRWLLRIMPGITPNQISLANLLPALISAFLMSMGGYGNALAGAVLFHISSVFDGCDGENARLTFRASGKGAWIDTICDVIAYFAFLVAIPTGLYRSTGSLLYPLLGLETVVSIILLYFLMTRYVKNAGSGGSMIKIVKDIEHSGNNSKNRFSLHKIVSKSAFIFRRDFFAFAFMILCLIGALPALMWLLACLAPFGAGYLYVFSRKQFGGAAELVSG
jgi:phosphatidylglycerophosphate synthase